MDSQMTQMTQLTEPSTCPPSGSKEPLGPTTYTIAGVKVEFPTKAYPSQIAMMSKVIQGLKHGKNCLLESPTGSGKTLALLCAALAWQRHEYIRVDKYNSEIDARQEASMLQLKQVRKPQPEAPNAAGEKDAKIPQSNTKDGSKNELETSGYFPSQSITDDSDDDFKPSKRPKSALVEPSAFPALQKAEEVSKPRPNASAADNKVDTPYFVPPEKKLTVPKIFYGTRTHKQIAQITRELRKTFYKTVRSVILASREHTCINPLLDGVSNKNEQCRELLDSSSTMGDGCTYHPGARKFGNFNNLQNHGILPGYDLEDFVKAGRLAKACPYYATRFLMLNADIIFCPYNYLIDPSIRASMSLELENQIVILDEAHNMEDASREAASFTLKQHEIIKAMQDCEKVKNIGGAEPFALGEMATMLSTLSTWIDEQSSKLKDVSYNTSGKCWTGTEIIAALHSSGLDELKVKAYEEYFKAITTQREKDIELMKERGLRLQLEKPSLTSISITIIENVFRLFQDMYKNNGLNRDDFRIALIKSTEKRRRDGHSGPYMAFVTHTVNVWCLNPAVAFAEIRDKVRAIVLTSGTLSPMHSFQSELGTPFPLKLEASHVIDINQVWAGVVGSGPGGISLNGSYQNAESLAYQDEVGAVVQFVCDTMPCGVLCFFSSYRMMDKMIERWQITRRYQQMEAKKVVVVEPRSGAANFESVMNEFYTAIKGCDDEGHTGGNTGALFFAVCRGKVSEGLDFSDNNARAVICVGIPFPNYRDMQVELKRDYNQQNIKRGLLPGSEWYEIQAFRALNQALGRCIRHRQDWGAILLIDDRYIKSPRYLQSLSRWIRSSVRNFEYFTPIINSLESFRDEMLARPVPVEPSFASQSYEVNSLSAMQGGGYGSDTENASTSALGFGTNNRQGQPITKSMPTFTDAFSSVHYDDDSVESTDFVPNTRLNISKFPDTNYSNKSKNSFNAQTPKPAGKNRGNQVNTTSPGIAALFARQIETAKSTITLSQTSSDSGISSDPIRSKRAREKKIRL